MCNLNFCSFVSLIPSRVLTELKILSVERSMDRILKNISYSGGGLGKHGLVLASVKSFAPVIRTMHERHSLHIPERYLQLHQGPVEQQSCVEY